MVAATQTPVRQGQGTDLSRFRYHTGATPHRQTDFCEPVLFRDVGPAGMALFLSGRLGRLAGPLSPILYVRTGTYVEPYRDAEEIGRLAFLRPAELDPWFSGIDDVYIADAGLSPQRCSIAFIPTNLSDKAGVARVSRCPDSGSLREELGGRVYDEMLVDVRERSARLVLEQQASEAIACPIRATFQTGNAVARAALRESMKQHQITESDLCSAWHHVPRERRDALNAWLAMRAREDRIGTR